MLSQRKINLPFYAQELLKPARFKFAKGGRGSAKSHTVARIFLLKAGSQRLRFLCAREYQNSIADSVHKLLSDIIHEEGLPGFEIQRDKILHRNGSEFMFKGIKQNIESIKSMEAIDYVWLEEADKISQRSLDVLIPTIRKEGSEIWFVYNPDAEDDPVHRMATNPPPGSVVLHVSWRDNPWFPDVLQKEKDYMFKVDPDKAMHVWEGECRSFSDAQVFKDKWEVEEFAPESTWSGPYFGADWGFSKDPTTLTRSWLNGKNLYIEHEWSGVGVDLNDLPACFDLVPGSRDHLIKGDNARPETISLLNGHGFQVEAAEKWPGSVEQGVSWLRSFEKIIIHPRCKGVASEFKNYSFKIDRVTQKVTPKIIDDYNHFIDSIRYAYVSLIRQNIGELSEDMQDLEEDNFNDIGEW